MLGEWGWSRRGGPLRTQTDAPRAVRLVTDGMILRTPYAGGLSIGDPRGRRPEPPRPRAERGAGVDPHAGAAGRATHRRRGAVLHARHRLRLLENGGRGHCQMGP